MWKLLGQLLEDLGNFLLQHLVTLERGLRSSSSSAACTNGQVTCTDGSVLKTKFLVIKRWMPFLNSINYLYADKEAANRNERKTNFLCVGFIETLTYVDVCLGLYDRLNLRLQSCNHWTVCGL